MSGANDPRGDLSAYDRYLRGMDLSMRQKVALTAAHLLGEGRVADMGMGSGKGSHALASLYPRLEVVGVDLDPTMVALAREAHRLPNLRFEAGDIARPLFPPGSLHGIFDSSVLHHVTSFRGYDPQAAARALRVQVPQLREGGVLILRDFLAPGDAEVWLDVPADDGDGGSDPRTCSTAALLERFSGEFRSLHASPGFPLQRLEGVPGLPPGWRRYRLARRHAAEFVLRKDYRADWEAEVREEYAYFTQDAFEHCFQQLGLRVLASTPIVNPWIASHRFEGRFAWWSLAGERLEWPATNYLIAGERVAEGAGVRFEQAGERPPLGYLRLEHHRHIHSGEVFDLVGRPFRTLDLVPFFEADGELYVLARQAYPRPILAGARTLDGSRSGGYVTEPLNVLLADRPLGQTLEQALSQDAGMDPSRILRVFPGTVYYPSPGGILEEVVSTLIQVEPCFVEEDLAPRSGFSSSGRVGAIAAQQILRAAQVGGLPDARLELNVYQLLGLLGRDPEAWIGEEILLEPCTTAPPTDGQGLAERGGGRVFRQVDAQASTGFMEIRCADYLERSAQGAVLARQPLEYAVPRTTSENTVAAALLLKHGGRTFLGVSRDDLPAAQAFRGHSSLLVAPAWRLPRDITTVTPARAWVGQRVRQELGIGIGRIWELGGRYHPSPGLTREAVFPMAFEVLGLSAAPSSLVWIPLESLVEQSDQLRDGHLRILCHRAAHALGLLAFHGGDAERGHGEQEG